MARNRRNAAFIVRACNSHAALVPALTQVMHELSALDGRVTGDTAEFARTALKLAGT